MTCESALLGHSCRCLKILEHSLQHGAEISKSALYHVSHRLPLLQTWNQVNTWVWIWSQNCHTITTHLLPSCWSSSKAPILETLPRCMQTEWRVSGYHKQWYLKNRAHAILKMSVWWWVYIACWPVGIDSTQHLATPVWTQQGCCRPCHVFDYVPIKRRHRSV